MTSRADIKKIFDVFCPSVPTTCPSRFVGRENECIALSRTILTPGRHAIVYGDRGIGKTSTAKHVASSHCADQNIKLVEYQCGTDDTFKEISHRILSDFDLLSIRKTKTESHERSTSAGIKAIVADGGASSKRVTQTEISELIQYGLTPDSFVQRLSGVTGVVVLDEFDRIKDDKTKLFLAEVIKTLSNYNVGLKFIFCGVANAAEELLGAHASLDRNLRGIKIPHMTDLELRKIIDDGLECLHLSFDERLKNAVVGLSSGLPYFTHLLCEELAVQGTASSFKKLTIADLKSAVNAAFSNIPRRILGKYEEAISSKEMFDPVTFCPQKYQKPSQLRKFVIHAAALAATPTPESIATVARWLITSTNVWQTKEYAELDGLAVIDIVDEISDIGDYMESNKDKSSNEVRIQFSSPFHKAVALMKAVTEYEHIPPRELSFLGGNNEHAVG